MSDETTLLSCPFCGGEAETRKANQDIDGTWHAASCGCPNCRVFFCGDGLYGHNGFADREDYDESLMQAIAAWNTRAELGSVTKPCYAADENYKRCKYSVNRGWCDNAPFLVWDDTGHLFITMGGLKTWDVTDDAKKWFADLVSGTCELKQASWDDGQCTWGCICSACNAHFEHETGIGYNFCPNCGKRVSA